jgi:hypothetical protein
LDGDNTPTSRKPIPHPFENRADAVARVESTIARYEAHGYDAENDYWWARAQNGDRMRFIIEAV